MPTPPHPIAPDTITLALWAVNLARPLNGLEAWAADVDTKMAEAKAAGADLLLMPEYAAEQWLAFKPHGLPEADEIAWLAAQAPDALALIRPLAKRHDMALLAGTMPWKHGDEVRNRAWLLLPDGREIAQDKLALTPAEMEPDGWRLDPGDEITLVEWRGLRLATCICLDVELPGLAAKLAPHRPDLLLVPSMTGKLSGYSRVFGCAKARAVELMAAVAACGVVGPAIGTTGNFTNVSGCAVYLPCEEELGFTGVHDQLPPVGEHAGDGPFLIARDVPMSTIRHLRDGGAEVWPGAWSADHIAIRSA